jgi:hypothetical protein
MQNDDIPKHALFIDDHPVPRPADSPADWVIWNAPRQLAGHRNWIADFCRGVHYAAIDPSQPDAARLTRDNQSLSAFPCRWVTMDEIMAWARGYYPPLGVDPDEFDEDDIIRAYAVHYS